eukprot:403338121
MSQINETQPDLDETIEERSKNTHEYLKKSRKISKQLNQFNVKKWLQKRCSERAKPFYLKSENELKQELQVENVFINFDDDGSNSLDCQEIFEMFHKNGIIISMNQIKELFKIVDEDGSGQLSLEEFKLFMFSEVANNKFRQIITKFRERNDLYQGCIPFSFNII